jgi:hypothetical protein
VELGIEGAKEVGPEKPMGSTELCALEHAESYEAADGGFADSK